MIRIRCLPPCRCTASICGDPLIELRRHGAGKSDAVLGKNCTQNGGDHSLASMTLPAGSAAWALLPPATPAAWATRRTDSLHMKNGNSPGSKLSNVDWGTRTTKVVRFGSGISAAKSNVNPLGPNTSGLPTPD